MIAGIHWVSPLGRFVVGREGQAVPLTDFGILVLGSCF